MENNYYPQPIQNPRSLRLKRLGVLAGFLGMGILLFWGVYSRSIIEIKAGDKTSGVAKYRIVNQSNGNVTEFESDKAVIKKHVRKANYEIVSSQKDSNFFAVVATKPFFGKSPVDVTLSEEKGREFVGNNPGPCMHFNKTLFSFSCGGKLPTLTKHTAADAENPTVTQNYDGDLEKILISSLFSLDGRTLAVVEGFFDLESTSETANLLELDSNLSATKNREFTTKDTRQLFKAERFQNGFLLYSNDLSRLSYHTSIEDSEGKLINIEKPSDDSLVMQQLSVSGDTIAASYTNSDRPLDSDDKNKRSTEERTVVQVYSQNTTRSFAFKGANYTSQVCAEQYICLVQDRKLTVYKIDGKKPEKLLEITNVYNVSSSDRKLLVNRYDGVLEIDPKTQQGHIQYSYGSYEPCGLEQVEGSGYVLCAINPKKDKVAILVGAEPGTDNIDKKVLGLIEQPYISNISIYRSFIYISPELGEPQYQEAVKGFGYDPELAKSVAGKINLLVDELGIDRSRYTVINSLE